MGEDFDSIVDGVLRFAHRHMRAFAIVIALIAVPASLIFLTPVMLEAVAKPMDHMPQMGGQPATFTFLNADGQIIGIKTLQRGLSPKAEQLLKEEILRHSLQRTAGGAVPDKSKGKVVFILKTR